MTRRGQIETGLFPVILLIVGVIILVVVVVMNAIHTGFKTGTLGVGMNADAKDAIVTSTGLFPRVLDFIFVLVALALALVSVYVSAQIPTNPMFAVLVVPFLLLAAFFSVHISNAWETATETTLATAAASMPATDFLLSHLLGYSLFVVGISGISFYRATQQNAGGGAFG